MKVLIRQVEDKTELENNEYTTFETKKVLQKQPYDIKIFRTLKYFIYIANVCRGNLFITAINENTENMFLIEIP